MADDAAFGGTKSKDRKVKYKQRLIEYLNTYKSIMLISVDNIGSNQMQKARIMLRGRGVILMGKNTIMRKVFRDEGEKNPKLLGLLPWILGNVGLVFTNDSLADIRKELQAEKTAAAAKGGQFAPTDVIIPAGLTALDPGQTTFFQAMNIATKITKGAIEILNDVKIITKGERVTSSAVGLLSKLSLKPFFYSIVVVAVYDDGDVYEATALDLTNDELSRKFGAAASKLAAISLAIGFPTKASIPHSFANAFKTLVSLSLATKYTFEGAAPFRELLDNPELLKAAQAAAAGGAKKDDAPAAAAAPEPEEEEPEEDAVDMFGGDEDY
jgi:large subunit ribosomal protein LP0